jgi:hypothetical protein
MLTSFVKHATQRGFDGVLAHARIIGAKAEEEKFSGSLTKVLGHETSADKKKPASPIRGTGL